MYGIRAYIHGMDMAVIREGWRSRFAMDYFDVWNLSLSNPGIGLEDTHSGCYQNHDFIMHSVEEWNHDMFE